MKSSWLVLTLSLLSTQSLALAKPIVPRIDVHSFVPGKSYGPISLGMSRKTVLSIMAAPPIRTHRHKTLMEDEWVQPGNSTLEVVYRHGKSIQLEFYKDNILSEPFSKIFSSNRWSLRLTVYDINDDQMGGYAAYFYDDVNRGITFVGGVQDDLILNKYGPEQIFIHRADNRAIPLTEGVFGTREAHPLPAFATQSDADRYDKTHPLSGP